MRVADLSFWSCFLYFLLPARSHGTLEEKIYRRQLLKNGLSLRLIDSSEVDRHFTSDSVSQLWTLEEGAEDEEERLAKQALQQVQSSKLAASSVQVKKTDDGKTILEICSDSDDAEEETKTENKQLFAAASAASSAIAHTSAAASSRQMVLDP